MAQYQTGTVSLTNGDATVTGSGTAFLSNVSVGDIFQRSGDTVNYFVASVTNDTSLELTTTYSGTSGSGLTYGITRDFTPNQGYPEMFPQDLNTAATFNEAMALIDEDFAGLGTAAYIETGTSTGQISLNDNGTFTPALNATYGTAITPGAGAVYDGSYRSNNGVCSARIVINFNDAAASPIAGDVVLIDCGSIPDSLDAIASAGTAVLANSLGAKRFATYEAVRASGNDLYLLCTGANGVVDYDDLLTVNISYVTAS